MSNGVNVVGVVTEDDVSAIISSEEKILKELAEVCKNGKMVKRKNRLDESFTNVGENKKMNSGDTSMKSLTNVANKGENSINNAAYRVLESPSNSCENLIVKCDDVFGETPSDARCRSKFLKDLGNTSKSETTSEGENLTDSRENEIYKIVGFSEGLTNASMGSEMDKCSTDAVGNVAMNSEDVPLTDIRESTINNGPIFEEGMKDANQLVSFVDADASVSTKNLTEKSRIFLIVTMVLFLPMFITHGMYRQSSMTETILSYLPVCKIPFISNYIEKCAQPWKQLLKQMFRMWASGILSAVIILYPAKKLIEMITWTKSRIFLTALIIVIFIKEISVQIVFRF